MKPQSTAVADLWAVADSMIGRLGHPTKHGSGARRLTDIGTPTKPADHPGFVRGQSRDAGTAYALPDGRVLVVGIAQTGEPYPAEVYEPRSGTWTSAGNLVYLPGSAFAVLADGSLLVIGGTDDDRVVATVRRFDPRTGTSVEVAPLPAPRTGAIAVRLADGRVLVAGGTVQVRNRDRRAPATSTALVYGPVLDVWTEASPMPFASEPGQGLLLRDGSALVIGGTVPGDPSVTDGCPSRAPIAWVARFVPAVTP
jgi:hypothetical protein